MTAKRWSLDEWRSFALRCQHTRDRIGRFLGTIPATKGFGAKHIDAWLAVERNMASAMIGLENVLARAHGEDVGVITFIHGPWGTPGDAGGNTKWNPRSPAILARTQWTEIGREVKAIRDEVMDLSIDLANGLGKTKPYVRRFRAVDRAIGRARSGLDSLVCLQHPGWDQFSHVFYGPLGPVEAVR